MVQILKRLLFIFDFTALPRSIARNHSLLWQLVKRNVSVRYRGSMLGFLWSFVHPLMMLCVYTFVFSVVFKARWGVDVHETKGSFAIILCCGIAFYSIFAECVGGSCSCITNNPNFVKKVIFPLEILPLAQCISAFIWGSVWFLLLFGGALFVFGRGCLSLTMLLLPVILIPLFLFSLGISYFVASLGTYVKDTSYVIQVILQILFFLTPIFYPISAVPEKYRWPMQINPLTTMIEQGRKVFLDGKLPNWGFLMISFLVSLLVLHLGFVWFYKTKKGFADVL